jgi:predicted aspartyl protease
MRRVGCIALVFAASVSTVMAADQCQMTRSPPLHVAMRNGIGVITAGINGTPVQLAVDTASSFSFLSMAAAKRLHLPLVGPYNLGSKGRAMSAYITTVTTLGIFGYQAHDVKLGVVSGTGAAGIDGTLGEDELRLADVEYDFASGVMRLVVPKHCGSQPLAYWAVGKGASAINLEPEAETGKIGRIAGWVRVNGVRLYAVFTTGRYASVLSRGAARRLGIAPGAPGVEPIPGRNGAGSPVLWSAPIATFQIGSETIEHTHLLVANGPTALGVDLEIGADFFESHHVYVANSQHRMYMTYNGGPVFALDAKKQQQSSRAGAAPRAGPGGIAAAHTGSP